MRQETASRASGARERGSARRALLAITAVIAATAAAAAWHRRIEDRRHSSTGRAEWIWYARAGRLPRPLHFYAFREWDLPSPPKSARALVFADPRAVVWINGTRVAMLSQRPGDALVRLDLAPHLVSGRNRVVMEASSPDGVGGILFAPEDAGAAIASGRGWGVSLDAREAECGTGTPAVVWGRPPQYPWGYPRLPD